MSEAKARELLREYDERGKAWEGCDYMEFLDKLVGFVRTYLAAPVPAPAEPTRAEIHGRCLFVQGLAAPQPEAPPTLADDGLLRELDAIIERGKSLSPNLIGRDALLSRCAARIRVLEAERERRNKTDPITRLHNLCDGLDEREQEIADSAFALRASRERERAAVARYEALKAQAEVVADAPMSDIYDQVCLLASFIKKQEREIAATPDSAALPTGGEG